MVNRGDECFDLATLQLGTCRQEIRLRNILHVPWAVSYVLDRVQGEAQSEEEEARVEGRSGPDTG